MGKIEQPIEPILARRMIPANQTRLDRTARFVENSSSLGDQTCFYCQAFFNGKILDVD